MRGTGRRVPGNPRGLEIGDAVQSRLEPEIVGVIERFERNVYGESQGYAWVATQRGKRRVETHALRLRRTAARLRGRNSRDRSSARDPETEKIDRLLAKLSQAGKDYLDEYMRAPTRADVFAAWKRVPAHERRVVDYLLDGIRPGYEEVESAVAHLYED